MVIKGGTRGRASSLAAHLERTDTNERMHVADLRGVLATDLAGALLEMEAVASGARSGRHFYHASINTGPGEILTPEQQARAIDRLETELGLTGQPRAVVEHLKEGRAHVHVVWSRINLATMTAIVDSHNFRRHEIVARELEREFGHQRVQGAHIERDGVARPERTPNLAQMKQAERTGLSPEEAKARLRALWVSADTGRSFAAALADAGWVLARGDKRGFVALDPAGEVRSVNKEITGLTAAKVRERLADIEIDALPSVTEARAQQRNRQQEYRQAHELAAEPTPRPVLKSEPEREWEDRIKNGKVDRDSGAGGGQSAAVTGDKPDGWEKWLPKQRMAWLLAQGGSRWEPVSELTIPAVAPAVQPEQPLGLSPDLRQVPHREPAAFPDRGMPEPKPEAAHGPEKASGKTAWHRQREPEQAKPHRPVSSPPRFGCVMGAAIHAVYRAIGSAAVSLGALSEGRQRQPEREKPAASPPRPSPTDEPRGREWYRVDPALICDGRRRQAQGRGFGLGGLSLRRPPPSSLTAKLARNPLLSEAQALAEVFPDRRGGGGRCPEGPKVAGNIVTADRARPVTKLEVWTTGGRNSAVQLAERMERVRAFSADHPEIDVKAELEELGRQLYRQVHGGRPGL